MTRALLVIDVQNDFTSGISGGRGVAERITAHLQDHASEYDVVVASRDWHDAVGDNGGHFPPAPEGSADPYVRHCVAGSPGADYDPAFDAGHVGVHVLKGQGVPGYSIFEGTTEDGLPFPEVVATRGIDRVTVVGLATDFCVRAAALDALTAGCEVEVLLDLCAGTDPQKVEAALADLRGAGVTLR